MNDWPTFKYDGRDIPIEIGYALAIKKLKPLGLNILDLFSDEEVIKTIMLNDQVMLKVWHYYVEQETGDNFDTAIEELKPDDMHKFKDKFWDAVVNFSPPPLRPALIEGWREAKKELKSLGKTLKSSYSDSSEEDSS